MYKLFLIGLTLVLTGCSTVRVPMYGTSSDTNLVLRELKITESISIGDISTLRQPDLACRAFGDIKIVNNMTPVAYIKKGLEDELKMAGAFGTKYNQIVLTGQVNKLEMSSSKGMFNGYWLIDLTITSSNGKQLTVNEYYEFESGFDAATACNNTSNAFMPAVQNLIGKVFKSPQFKSLLAKG